jgi:hypothetical protein
MIYFVITLSRPFVLRHVILDAVATELVLTDRSRRVHLSRDIKNLGLDGGKTCKGEPYMAFRKGWRK